MNFLPTEFNYIGTFFLSTDGVVSPLQGTNPYPTKREVRKIIDSKGAKFGRGYPLVQNGGVDFCQLMFPPVELSFRVKLELFGFEELNGGKQRVSVDLLEHLQVDFLMDFFLKRESHK